MEAPFIQEVVYDTASQDLFLRWEPRSNTTKYNFLISTCGDSMLMETSVNYPCSVSRLSGIDFTEYELLLVAVQSCEADNKCGVDLPAGVSEKNIVAISMQVSQ